MIILSFAHHISTYHYHHHNHYSLSWALGFTPLKNPVNQLKEIVDDWIISSGSGTTTSTSSGSGSAVTTTVTQDSFFMICRNREKPWRKLLESCACGVVENRDDNDMEEGVCCYYYYYYYHYYHYYYYYYYYYYYHLYYHLY